MFQTRSDAVPMRRRALLLVACVVAAATFMGALGADQRQAAAAATSPTGAQAFLDGFTKRGLTMFSEKGVDNKAKREKMRGMIAEGFDIDSIGRFVLARHYAPLTEAQRKEYHGLYFDYVLATYFRRLIDFGKLNLNMVGNTPTAEGDAVVETLAERPDGPPLRIRWRIRADDAGRFRIVDIIAEGVSIAVTQRSDFNAVMTAKGYDGLIEALRQKIKESDGN
jgi:phospholipid transport system substrate-binding protein